MRNHQKSGKARFQDADVRSVIEAAAQSKSTTSQAPSGSRSSAIQSRRPGTSRIERASVARPQVDPAIAAVKRYSGIRILGTDPDALAKLNLKLASLLSLQENMARTNEFLANNDRAGLLRYGYSAEGVEELFLCGPGQQPGYSRQELANMALNVERVRDRIAELTRNMERPAKIEQGRDYAYQEDPDQQRVLFVFPSKPALSVRQLLGQSGFRWSVTRSAWMRPMSENSIEAAENVRQALNQFPEILVSKGKNTLH